MGPREAGAADVPFKGERVPWPAGFERVAIPERCWPAAALQRDVPIELVLSDFDVVVGLTAW
jgi:hypothetical protein